MESPMVSRRQPGIIRIGAPDSHERRQGRATRASVDILCLQEVRDWDSVAELVSVLLSFRPLIVSRFREFGSSGPITIQQTGIASRWHAEAAWSESFKPSPATPPRGFSFAAIRRANTMLLVYSVHFKSNRGDPQTDMAKRGRPLDS